MASRKLGLFVAAVVSAAAFVPPSAVAQLRTDYYASVCPNLESIVRGSVRQSMAQSAADPGFMDRGLTSFFLLQHPLFFFLLFFFPSFLSYFSLMSKHVGGAGAPPAPTLDPPLGQSMGRSRLEGLPATRGEGRPVGS